MESSTSGFSLKQIVMAIQLCVRYSSRHWVQLRIKANKIPALANIYEVVEGLKAHFTQPLSFNSHNHAKSFLIRSWGFCRRGESEAHKLRQAWVNIPTPSLCWLARFSKL